MDRGLATTAPQSRANGKLKDYWWQQVNSASQEVNRLSWKWSDQQKNEAVAKERARRTREVERNVGQLVREALNRAATAKTLHDVAYVELAFRQDDSNHAALSAMEQDTHMAEDLTRRSADRAREKLKEVRAAVGDAELQHGG